MLGSNLMAAALSVIRRSQHPHAAIASRRGIPHARMNSRKGNKKPDNVSPICQARDIHQPGKREQPDEIVARL
jgi:hypothetical protein